MESFKDIMKRWGREVYLFLTSFIFLKNLVGILTFLVGFLFLTSWWMKCYTNHGESLQVHDYVDLDLDDAIRKAKSRSFSIVVSDSIFIPGKPANLVIGQNPAPLSRVKEDRKIYLRVTKSLADMVTLPNLFDGSDDFHAYQTKLKRIEVGSKIVGRQYNNKLEENTILAVIYNGDTITNKLDDKYQVPKGAVVEFIVTEKGGGAVPIPNLICQKYDAARFVIGNFNLNIGSVIKDATVTDETSAYIYRQEPRYSTSGTVRVGEQIDIYLTQQRPDNCGEDEFNIENLEQEGEGEAEGEAPEEF
jgi:beta-lactam-binding protein with PASTA domain